MRFHPFALCLVAAASPVAAEVKSVAENGFEVSKTVFIAAPPAKVYAALGKVGQWWSSSHSWSGDARNMTMKMIPGGCFCEALPKDKGVVEHGRVVFAQPGKMLRLQASLGPLQAEGVMGTLTWTLVPKDNGTEITQSYVVGGYVRSGAKVFAPIVDQVLAEQLTGLTRFLGGR